VGKTVGWLFDDETCRLHEEAARLGFVQPDHCIFPWHGRNKRIDPTKAMTSWRSAWRSIRKAAGLQGVRFDDRRHTAITTLAEKGLPDWVIQAQVGHVAPEMMKVYSHIRRQALNQEAAALKATTTTTPAPPEKPAAVAAPRLAKRVMSQSTSQSADRGGRVLKFAQKNGSPHWTISATGSAWAFSPRNVMKIRSGRQNGGRVERRDRPNQWSRRGRATVWSGACVIERTIGRR